MCGAGVSGSESVRCVDILHSIEQSLKASRMGLINFYIIYVLNEYPTDECG